MMQIMNLIFLAATIISAMGLIYIIYSRSIKSVSRKLYVITLFLVIGYLVSHAVHFVMMSSEDVTILDQSCHSFLILIILALCFFSYYYPDEKNMNVGLKAFLIIPTIVLIVMLWSGLLISESHAHKTHFEAHYKEYYAAYLIWYVILLLTSIYYLVKKIFDKSFAEYALPLLTILAGLIITNLTAFIFGLYLPWILGFYYLVEVSPLAFFIGVIITTTIAITKFNLFPAAVTKIQSFSLNKKIFFAAIIVVPVIILLIQIPLGRIIFNIQTAQEWQQYFIISIAGGILVSSAMAFIISKIIAGPINKLTEKTSEISKGKYGIKVDITSNDELGRLAETFNGMSEALKNDTDELREKQERIGLLLNAFEKSNAAICAFEPDGRIIEINSQFVRLLNSSKEKLLVQNIFEIVKNENDINDLAKSLISFKKDGNYREEVVINRGEAKIYLINISPFTIDEDFIAGYFLIMVDITRIKNLEYELAKNEKLAALGKLSAVLAHEIKTPLTSIKMNTDMLAESLLLNDEDKNSMQIINREITRLNNLVKEVLQYSRQVELNIKSFNIIDLFSEIIIQTNRKYGQKNFKVINKCDNVIIEGDKEKLKQVLLNIIENSYEAASENGQIIIDCKIKGNMIAITFTDNGSGVTGELKSKIFDPFFTTKSSGTGLGLAVAQKIVEQHKGKMELVSSKQGETIFKLKLAIKQDRTWTKL